MSLENLAEEMGEDFGFGFDDDAGDPNVLPEVPVPSEDTAKRSYDMLGFSWAPLQQCLTRLELQVMPAKRGFDHGFDSSHGKSLKLKKPEAATEGLITGLDSETPYVARLVATNPKGVVQGPSSEPVATTLYAPPTKDLSGWIYRVHQRGSISGTLRRMSMRSRRQRLWFVLDGALLTYYKSVGGDEVGYIHLGKIEEILWRPEELRLQLHYREKKPELLELEFESYNPNVPAEKLFSEWRDALLAIRRTLTGNFGADMY
eukprot:m.53468 g.53468  ORF g.53468 m.53468 type:complete len:260 (+) comp6766_c0_seq1:82-861(+)